MNRVEFMRQLEALLWDISSMERREAVQYYNDYFDDAGSENEQEVIRALGSPERVAENIKSGLAESAVAVVRSGSENRGAAKEEDSAARGEPRPGNGYREGADQAQGRQTSEYQESSSYTGNSYKNPDSQGSRTGVIERARKAKEEMPGGMLLLIIVSCLLIAPIVFPVITGVLGTVAGLIAGWFGAIVGFAIAAVVLFIVLIVLVVLGIMCLVVEPWACAALLGAGLLCGGLGFLFLMLSVAMAGIATPAIFRGIGWLFGACRKRFA